MSCKKLTVEKTIELIRKYQKSSLHDFAVVQLDCGEYDLMRLDTALSLNSNIIAIVRLNGEVEFT